jgi:hypothetical protein
VEVLILTSSSSQSTAQSAAPRQITGEVEVKKIRGKKFGRVKALKL